MGALLRNWLEARRYRLAVRQLKSLPPGELAALGIREDEIDRLAREAFHIMETKTSDFGAGVPGRSLSRCALSLRREKQAALPKGSTAAPSTQNVINLMYGLKRSLEAKRPLLSRKPTSRPVAKSPVRTARPSKDR
jgi:non-homologous end joining protein Ku